MEVKGVALLLALATLAVFIACPSAEAARLDVLDAFVGAVPDASPEPCCDTGCGCTLPIGIPPTCICLDRKDHCYPGCNACFCTRTNPPQCRCRDVLHYCPGPCAAK